MQSQSSPSIAPLSTEKDQLSSSSTPTPIKVRLHEPTFGEDEIHAAVEVLRSTNVTSGVKVREFESQFDDHAVLCNSGSSANLLAIAALTNPVTPNRLMPGDEVIVSALSWSTTVWPLVQHGLVPVIVDIDPDTLNIDMVQVLQALGPKTKAIMPVHVYGNPCDMMALATLKSQGIRVIEDCCEAFGASDGERPVGSVGDVSTFSFYFSHHMTMLEGGLVTAKTRETGDMVRILRAHGWVRDLEDSSAYREAYPDIDPKFLFVNAGYNLRATELQAAMGLVQLMKFPGFLAARRDIATALDDLFEEHFEFLRTQKENGASSWFGYPITVNQGSPFTAQQLRAHFEANGIETRSIICGNIARQPGMKLWPHRVFGELKHADHVMSQGFSIGCHQGMTYESVAHVRNVLNEFMA